MSNCKCDRGVVCRCAVNEDDMSWVKGFGLVAVGIMVLIGVLPGIYHYFTGPAPTSFNAVMETGKPLAVGERLELGGKLYVVSKPLDLNAVLREVNYNLGYMTSVLIQGQYVTPVTPTN